MKVTKSLFKNEVFMSFQHKYFEERLITSSLEIMLGPIWNIFSTKKLWISADQTNRYFKKSLDVIRDTKEKVVFPSIMRLTNDRICSVSIKVNWHLNHNQMWFGERRRNTNEEEGQMDSLKCFIRTGKLVKCTSVSY